MTHQVKVRSLLTKRYKEEVFKMINEKNLEYSGELIAVFRNGKLKDVHPNYSPF